MDGIYPMHQAVTCCEGSWIELPRTRVSGLRCGRLWRRLESISICWRVSIFLLFKIISIVHHRNFICTLRLYIYIHTDIHILTYCNRTMYMNIYIYICVCLIMIRVVMNKITMMIIATIIITMINTTMIIMVI